MNGKINPNTPKIEVTNLNHFYIWYGFALLFLSQSSVIFKWSHGNVLVMSSWRLLLGGLVLFVMSKLRFSGEMISGRDLRSVIISGFCFFLHLYAYAYSAQNTYIAHCMLIFSTNPLFTALGARIFFGEKFGKKHFIAYGFCAMGIVFLIYPSWGAMNNVVYKSSPVGLPVGTMSTFWGDISGLVSAITFSVYALSSKKLRSRLPNLVFSSRLFLSTGVFFFLATALQGKGFLPESEKVWMAIGLLTVFPLLLGHGIFIYCIGHINIHILSLAKLLEPIVASLVAILIFQESLAWTTVLAFIMILVGVAVVVRE